MSALVLSGVYADDLLGAEISFESGLHVVLGRVSDGTAALVATISGLTRPRRGTVRVGPDDPWRAPAARARIGALLAVEPELSRGPVLAAVAEALALHGAPGPADRVLADAGISRLGKRRGDRLSAVDARAVALTIALEVPEPRLLALHEPLADVGSVDRRWALTRIAERVQSGTCVVCTTASPRDAAELGGRVTLLDRGRFVRQPGAPLSTELVPGLPAELRIRTPHPERLAALVSAARAVTGVRFDQDEHPGELRVRGAEVAPLSLAVIRAAREGGILVEAIEPTLPSLDEARAASVALWRAAYERAYLAARPQPPADAGTALPGAPPAVTATASSVASAAQSASPVAGAPPSATPIAPGAAPAADPTDAPDPKEPSS